MAKPRPRPKRLPGFTERVQTGCGGLYVTVNRDELGVFEVFAVLGHVGGCPPAQLEALGRMLSLNLRSGVKLSALVKQIQGIRCPKSQLLEGDIEGVLSCADGMAKVLAGEDDGAEVPVDAPPAPVESIEQCVKNA